MKKLALMLAVAATFALAQEGTPATVIEIITNNDDLSTLVTALETAGLVETLQGEGPFTVLAPSDEAFDALPEGELDRLLANPEALRQILTYHVAGEEIRSEAISEFADDSSSEQPLVTLQGGTLNFTTRENADEPIYINNEAVITEADIEAGNGLVHVIDMVLLPGEVGDETGGAMMGGHTTGGDATGGSPSGQ